MKTKLILLITLAIVSSTYAQVAEQWAARYNSSGNYEDDVRKIQTDPSGNIIVTGSSFNASSDRIYTTIKYSPAGGIMWIANYNGPVAGEPDAANDLAVDASGNVYVTGLSNTATSADYLTIKYNSAGIQQWTARYSPGYLFSIVPYIAVDNQGNVYITGAARYNNQNRIATIKYNSAGVQQWLLNYVFENSSSHCYAIEVDKTGGIIVTGGGSSNSGNYDMVTIKYNTLGFAEWVQRFNWAGSSFEAGYDIAIDNLNNVYIGGIVEVTGSLSDGITLKYSSSGVQQWASKYNGSANSIDYATGITADSSGNVYTALISYNDLNFNTSDMTTIKHNTSGTQQWVKRYNGGLLNNRHYPNEIITDRYNNIYVTGASGQGNPLNNNFLTIKYNPAGDSLWTARFVGPTVGGEAVSLALDSLNNIYITGYDFGLGTSRDYVTIKYTQAPLSPVLSSPANGSTGVSLTPQLDWSDVPFAVTYKVQVSADSTFATTVINQTGLTQSQYTVQSGVLQNNVRYFWRSAAVNSAGSGPWSDVWNFTTGFTGINQTGTEIPKVFRLYNNYPNPFNPATKIKFDIPTGNARLVKLTVYDMLGRQITELVNQSMQPGSYEVEFDGSSLSSGVYFYRIETGEFTDLKKMVIVK